MMTQEEVTRLVDACRDGDIADDELRELQHILRTRNVMSEWVLDELELSGMIAQALDPTNGDSFVRGLLERLTAEETVEDFIGKTHERLTAEQIGLEVREPEKQRVGLLGMIFGRGSRNGDSTLRPQARRNVPMVLMILVAVAFAVIAAYTLGTYRNFGKVVSSSSGVIVEFQDSKEAAQSNLILWPSSRLVVPESGQVVVMCKNGTQLRAEARSTLLLAPGGNFHCVMLETGKLHVERHDAAASKPTIIQTPHLEVTLSDAIFSCIVTPSSTRIDVKMGQVSYLTKSGTAETLVEGKSVIITQ